VLALFVLAMRGSSCKVHGSVLSVVVVRALRFFVGVLGFFVVFVRPGEERIASR